MVHYARLRAAIAVLFVLTFSSVLEAATVAKVNENALAPLRKAAKGARIRLEALPLADSRSAIIDLQEFDVWAPGGKVLIHRESGVDEVDPPATRFFRGSVDGDPQSFAYFSVEPKNGRVEGLVVTREHKYALSANPRRNGAKKPSLNPADEPVDHFLTQFEAEDEMPDGRAAEWACTVDKNARVPKEEEENDPAVVANAKSVVIAQGISGTQSYEVTLEIETDFNLYQNAGSDTTALTNYVTNLTGAISTIYNRDLHTNVLQKYLNIYTTDDLDPWTATDSFAGLAEVGRKYHEPAVKPAGRRTSAVVLLSGVNYGGGRAWEGLIGGADFDLDGVGGNEWAGPYAWCGAIGNFGGVVGLGNIPDPNDTVNGTVYGMPSGFQNYWPLSHYAHELGHNFGGHHTHCVAISDAERAASGFTDNSPPTAASNFVDHCYAQEQEANCYGGVSGGTNYIAGSAGANKGTLMSYCNNVRISGVPQSRFIFGVGSEPSAHELDDYMLDPAGPGLDGGNRNIVNGVGNFTISAITAPATVTPNSAGNVASITAIPATGATYAWTITNGTITSLDTTSSIIFTAGPTGEVVLRASGYSTQKVGVTDSKTVTIQEVSFEPPVNVFATATSSTTVDISWAAVIGATHYQVYRAQQQGGFGTLVDTTTSTTLTDSTALANTAYQYVVTAGDGAANWSVFSDDDMAVTVIFTDPTLTATSTKVKVVHFTELLTAVNAVNTLIGSSTIGFTGPAPGTSVTVRRQHVLDLRASLDAARVVLGYPAISYTDPTLTATSTTIKGAHITDLRGGVQ